MGFRYYYFLFTRLQCRSMHLLIVKLCLAAWRYQAVNQVVNQAVLEENNKIVKFHRNSLQEFGVGL